MRESMKIDAGTMAWAKVLDTAPIVRKIWDMVKVVVMEKRKKTKKWPGDRRRFVMKYKIRLNTMPTTAFEGRSTIIELTASADGWYKAYLSCFSTMGRCCH